MITNPIFINNGDSLYIEPVNKDNIHSDLTLYAGSVMYFRIYDKNGDNVVNSPVGNIKWNTRPGGYNITFQVGNHASYSDAYVMEDISVPHSKNILVANSKCNVGGIFQFSIYLYV